MRHPLTVLLLALAAACASLSHPDAKVIDLDHKIEAAADATTFLLHDKVIKPDEAEIVHGALTVAKKHNDRMREVLLKAKAENRAPTELELQQAKGIYQLALDALRVAAEKLAAYEARKEKS